MNSPALPPLQSIDIQAVIAGQKRLSPLEALSLYHQAPLYDLGRWATAMADRFIAQAYPGHGPVRTYVIDRNINYTNICSIRCTFCAFSRRPGQSDAYVLDRRQLHQKIAELLAVGGTQILLQGGVNPQLPLEFYEDMLRGIKAEFPTIHIHGFSPPELVEMVATCRLEGFPTTAPARSHEMPWDTWLAKLEAILRRLIAAGLDSIPGGGAEIFAPHVRRRLSPRKATARQWLAVMSTAHRLGLFTTATMMFGHIEGIADRIDHMLRIRQAQDQALANNWPGRYLAFIAWPFQRENTSLGRLKDWDPDLAAHRGEIFPGDDLALRVLTGQLDPEDRAACTRAVPQAGRLLRTAGAVDYLRTQAVARLFLDNIQSVGSSWVTMGPRIGQLGLLFGATDMGSIMMEENVVAAAGTTYRLDEAVLCHLIRTAGFIPAQRDSRYRLIKIHTGPDSPDRRVQDWSAHRVRSVSPLAVSRAPDS